MLSIKAHNILDYAAGVLLLFAPAIFGFAEINSARNSFLFSGGALIVYSLFTKYDYSLWRLLSFRTHMSLDVLNGLFLMLAPWIFGFRDLLTSGQEILHYVLALGIFGLVAATRPQAGISAGGSATKEFSESSSAEERSRRAG